MPRVFRLAVPVFQIDASRAFYETYLATDDLDAVYGRALRASARIASSIETRPWGERSFYCLDPDGNRLCFVDDSTLFLGRGAASA